MNRLNPAFAAILVAVTLGACDSRDTEEDRIVTPSESALPDAAASADTMQSTDGMAADRTASDRMAADGVSQNDMNSTSDAMSANGMVGADGASATGGASASGTPTAAGSADADFYRQALGSGTSEVALSEYASRTSSSAEVKRVAEMLVTDHRELNGKLRTASGMGEVTPPPMDAKAGEDIKARTGAAFDTAYLQKMSDGHKKSIVLYEATSTGAGDAETRRLASAALPKLREHAGHVEKALAAVSTKR